MQYEDIGSKNNIHKNEPNMYIKTTITANRWPISELVNNQNTIIAWLSDSVKQQLIESGITEKVVYKNR